MNQQRLIGKFAERVRVRKITQFDEDYVQCALEIAYMNSESEFWFLFDTNLLPGE